MQPDVIQIELGKKKARNLIVGLGFEFRARERLTTPRIINEKRQERRAFVARLQRLVFRAVVADRLLDIEQQR